MAENDILFGVNPSPRTLRSEGDVPLPVLYGNDHATVEGGIVLRATGLSADSEGDIWVRPGSVVIPDSGAQAGEYMLANDASDGDTDNKADQIVNAAVVLIVKATINLRYGAGLVGAYHRGGFLGTRMPSVADNATMGIEDTVKAALKDRGFVFGEDFGPIND